MAQAGSDDRHRLEKGVASSGKSPPLLQETCCSAFAVAESLGCYERSPAPSGVSRKGRQGLVVVGGHLVRAGYDTFGSDGECGTKGTMRKRKGKSQKHEYTFSSWDMAPRSLSCGIISSCLNFGKSVFGMRISSPLISLMFDGGPGGNRLAIDGLGWGIPP